jgi:predicted nucleic acid-binding protein
MVVWWASEVECVSALARRQREGALAPPAFSRAVLTLNELAEAWTEVASQTRLRTLAIRLLRTHPLRAADALQLAAALVVAGDRPAALPFVSADRKLLDAADAEGLAVVALEA